MFALRFILGMTGGQRIKTMLSDNKSSITDGLFSFQ